MQADPDPAPRRLRVPSALDGERLDRALAALVPDASRARLQELVRDGGVRVAGAVARRPSQAVRAGEELELVRVPRSRERPGGSGAGFRVVHEEEAFAVVDKPAGMVAHPSGVVRGGTLAELAAERWGALPAVQGADRPGIVHRLDADTSGLVVVARRADAAERLVALFRERLVEKTYEALVHGETRFDSDWIEAPLGRRPDRPDRIAVAEGGREARTWYETRERFRGFSALVCRPHTGRTHQLRVHLTHVGHPLVGDRVYKGKSARLPEGAPPLGRHALHAAELAFPHPLSGEPLCFRAEPPEDMRRFLAWLRAERSV